MKSRMVKTDFCIFCNRHEVEHHHVFYGTSNRKVSDKYGMIVPLCSEHHRGSGNSPHHNAIIDRALKCWGQSIYEKEIGDRNDFRREFGRSYL